MSQMQQIALAMKKETQVRLCSIKLYWKSQISSNVLRWNDKITAVEEYWKKIIQIKVQNHVRFYNSFCQEKTFVFVSHDRFVSIYNMSTEKWIYHQNMHDEAREIWNIEDKEDQGEKKESGFVINLRCIVGSGTIKKLKFVLPAYSKDKVSGSQPQITFKEETMSKGTVMTQRGQDVSKLIGLNILSKAMFQLDNSFKAQK